MAGAYDADPIFQANPLHIDYLMTRINSGLLAIPDFQRDFTWEPKRTAALIRSIMARYPAGTFLFWAVGNDNEMFGWRPFEGAPERSVRPQELVLDGQQRLTSLFRALNGAGDEVYFIRVGEFVELPSVTNPDGRLLDAGEIDFDEAVYWLASSSKEASAAVVAGDMYGESLLPISQHRTFDEWLDEYADYHAAVMDRAAVKKLLRAFRDRYLTPLKSYGFPVVVLPSQTRIEAVATVFETLNSTGKPLGPFELLTARFYPDGVNLRLLWDEALASYDVLEEFGVDEYSVLQALTLRTHRSAQRSDVLRKLTASDVKKDWESVARGFAKALEFLARECGVVSSKVLPYTMVVVPLAAVWNDVESVKGPAQVAVLNGVKQFFWCSVFMTNYDQGANSQAGADYQRLRTWLLDKREPAPEAVSGFALLESTIAGATTRRKALYAGMLALCVSSGALDFHSAETLDRTRVRADKIDSHHVFPKAYLKGRANAAGTPYNSELALNRVLIDPGTNKTISANPPSVYFDDLAKHMQEDEVIAILASHLIPAEAGSAFRDDDYESFISQRLETMVEAVEGVTSRVITRDVSGT